MSGKKRQTENCIKSTVSRGYGVGEPGQTEIPYFVNEDALKHLPLLRFLGDDKLTEVYVVGKATLRRIWKDMHQYK